MQVLFINNSGGGFAEKYSVTPGTTVATFVTQKTGNRFSNYRVRVNRDITDADYVLQDEDKVSVTPFKIAGAIS